MDLEYMCRLCKHNTYCMGAFKKDHWCGNRIEREEMKGLWERGRTDIAEINRKYYRDIARNGSRK